MLLSGVTVLLIFIDNLAFIAIEDFLSKLLDTRSSAEEVHVFTVLIIVIITVLLFLVSSGLLVVRTGMADMHDWNRVMVLVISAWLIIRIAMILTLAFNTELREDADEMLMDATPTRKLTVLRIGIGAFLITAILPAIAAKWALIEIFQFRLDGSIVSWMIVWAISLTLGGLTFAVASIYECRRRASEVALAALICAFAILIFHLWGGERIREDGHYNAWSLFVTSPIILFGPMALISTVVINKCRKSWPFWACWTFIIIFVHGFAAIRIRDRLDEARHRRLDHHVNDRVRLPARNTGLLHVRPVGRLSSTSMAQSHFAPERLTLGDRLEYRRVPGWHLPACGLQRAAPPADAFVNAAVAVVDDVDEIDELFEVFRKRILQAFHCCQPLLIVECREAALDAH